MINEKNEKFARVLVCSKAQDDEDEFFTASRRRSRALSFRLLFFYFVEI